MSLKSPVAKLPLDADEEEPEQRAGGNVAGGSVAGSSVAGGSVAAAVVRPPAERKVKCPRLLLTLGTSVSQSDRDFAISVSPTAPSTELPCVSTITQACGLITGVTKPGSSPDPTDRGPTGEALAESLSEAFTDSFTDSGLFCTSKGTGACCLMGDAFSTCIGTSAAVAEDNTAGGAPVATAVASAAGTIAKPLVESFSNGLGFWTLLLLAKRPGSAFRSAAPAGLATSATSSLPASAPALVPFDRSSTAGGKVATALVGAAAEGAAPKEVGCSTFGTTRAAEPGRLAFPEALALGAGLAVRQALGLAMATPAPAALCGREAEEAEAGRDAGRLGRVGGGRLAAESSGLCTRNTM